MKIVGEMKRVLSCKSIMKNRVNLVVVALLVAVSVGGLIQAKPVFASSGTWDSTLGWDFECHSNTHPSLIGLTDAQIRGEMAQVNAAFKAQGYAPPQHDAYPYGDYDFRVENIVSQYRKTGRTVWGEMMTYPVTDWYEMMAAQLVSTTTWSDITGWIDSCVANKALLHIFTHDVSPNPSEYGCTPAMLTKLLGYLVQEQNAGKLMVMTMSQAYDYWSTATAGKATVVVSFDDANESDYTVVYPLFVARGLKGTSYIVTSFIGDSGSLTWDEIARMRGASATYAVHLESKQNSSTTANLGTITFDGTSYGLPSDISKTAKSYQAQFSATLGYAFDHWETAGSVTVTNATANPTPVAVNGAGTLRAIFKVYTSVLFADGFESGTFGAWTGTRVSSGETASVFKTLPHQGTYSAKFASNGTRGFEDSYSYKSIASSSDLYGSGYFYVSKSGIANDGNRFFPIVFTVSGNPVAYAGWVRAGGVVRWDLIIRDGTGWATAHSSTSPLLNKWYNVQLHWKNNAGIGVGELWVDGTLVCSITGKNTGAYGNANQVRFGLAELYNCGATSVYCDDCVISRTKIG